jgi:hypothetical protein
MAESQEINQLEYRWQMVSDMTPIAGSMSSESARLWVQRIGVWVRHPSVDVPTESVRYEMFGNGTAALAWRLRDRQAITSADAPGARPVVSRVLVGPASLLTPEAAAAVCYVGLPEAIGPQPGTATVGEFLPTVTADVLTGLVAEKAAALDEAAARERGLDSVLAAALGDRDTALSVQLPERDITRSPRGNSQAVLLWGLRRTVWPVLGRDGRRGWSFSTFEPPLSDMDPSTLPDIVFRLAQAARHAAPQATRKEIRVRPQDPVRPPVITLAQHLASLLVIAYAEHGGDELGLLITRAVTGKLSADRRIEAVYNALDAEMPGVTIATKPWQRTPADATGTDRAYGQLPLHAHTPASADTSTTGQTPAAPQDSAVSPVPGTAPLIADPLPASAAQESALTMPVTPEPIEPLTAAETTIPSAPVVPATGTPPAPLISSVPSLGVPNMARWADVSPGESAQEATPLFAGHEQEQRAGTPPLPGTLSRLLALLVGGPATQGFERALTALCASNFQSTPNDRATARRLMRDHSWYTDVLQQQDLVPVKDTLVTFFRHAVIPDLAEPLVVDELLNWIGERKAPETVIGALYAAAVGSTDAPQLMEQAIGPALAGRWRTEHGIYVPQAPPPAAWDTAPGTRDAALGTWDAALGTWDAALGTRDAGHGTPVAAADNQRPADPSPVLLNLLERKVPIPVPLAAAVLITLIVLFFLVLS